MGEYAILGNHQVKIGTCENMYYLRADQRHMVRPERGSVNPASNDHQRTIRFRFPWPDEDTVLPGAFDPYDRAVAIHGEDVTLPDTLEHYAIQFVSTHGYNLCLPCPEGPKASHGLTVHRNGFAGRVRLVQQAYRNGFLVPICECGGCGARYNLPELKDAEPLILACRAEADRHQRRGESGTWWHTVADRIEAGYGVTVHA